MKKHLIRSQRPAKMLVPDYPVTVYHTYCNWHTMDRNAVTGPYPVQNGDYCKRCTKAYQREIDEQVRIGTRHG